MKVGDLVHDYGDEVGIIMEVIDDENVVVMWPYGEDTETMKTWQLGLLDSIFERDTFCP